MPAVSLPITNGAYLADSLPVSAQECTNLYVTVPQVPSMATDGYLVGTPGITQLATSGTLQQVNRGAWVLNGVPYFVNGDGLYRLESSATVLTYLGEISGTGRVSMSDNGSQLFVLVPGGSGYIFTSDPDTLTPITDPDFTANGNPQYVVFIDGYFVLTTDSKKFICSNLNNGLAYSALDFGSAEANPDDTVSPFVFKNQLYITGTQTTEAFQNIGASGFPFQRSGLYLSKGCAAPFCISESNDSMIWIGAGKNESPAIWALAGNTTQKVSTNAIDSILQRFTEAELSAAFSWSYAQNGAYFVGFALPTTTLVLETITGRWHERKSEIVNAKGIKGTVRNRINSIVSAYGRVLVGDSVDGRIGELSIDVYQEYVTDIIRRFSTQPFLNNQAAFFMPSLELTVESGVGNELTDNPLIRMDISNDGGKTYRDDRARQLGRVGEYNRRAIWRRNGRFSRFAVLRFTLSDPVKPVIISLTADIRG